MVSPKYPADAKQIYDACKSGDIDALIQAVSIGQKRLSDIDFRYDFAAQAAKNGHQHILEYLIVMSPNAEAKEHIIDTAFGVAAAKGQGGVLKFLFELFTDEEQVRKLCEREKKDGAHESVQGYLNPELAILIGKQRRELRKLKYTSEEIEGIEKVASKIGTLMYLTKEHVTPELRDGILLGVVKESGLSEGNKEVVIEALSRKENNNRRVGNPVIDKAIDIIVSIIDRCIELSKYLGITPTLSPKEEAVREEAIFTRKVQSATEKRQAILERKETPSSNDRSK